MVFFWLLVILIVLCYLWLKNIYAYWKNHGVINPKPFYPFGNIGSIVSFSRTWSKLTSQWYSEFPNEPYIGYYKCLTPAILIRDVDLIKKVLIDDFDCFSENAWAYSEQNDPLLKGCPCHKVHDEWKTSRTEFCFAFTPEKTKILVPEMNSVGEQLVNFIGSHPHGTDFDAKCLANRFSLQDVFKCTLSLDAGCLNINQYSEFFRIFEPLYISSESSIWIEIKCLFSIFLPKWINKWLPISFSTKEADQLFRREVSSSIASRPHGIERNDILQAYLQARDQNDIPDQSIISYLFATAWCNIDLSSNIISDTLYELAVNPVYQERLFDEIAEMLKTYDEKFTNESLEDLIYLDGILYETMRLHAPEANLMKVCTKRFRMPRTRHQVRPFVVRPGMTVVIPVQSIHMDPQHYPEPDVFRPERFFPDEQQRRHKGTYLAFGIGPRMCPTVKFCMTELKVAVVHIVRSFRVVLSPRRSERGIYLQFIPR